MQFKAKPIQNYDIKGQLYFYDGHSEEVNRLLSKDSVLQRIQDDLFNVIKGSCKYDNGMDKNGSLCAGLYISSSHFKKLEVTYE